MRKVSRIKNITRRVGTGILVFSLLLTPAMSVIAGESKGEITEKSSNTIADRSLSTAAINSSNTSADKSLSTVVEDTIVETITDDYGIEYVTNRRIDKNGNVHTDAYNYLDGSDGVGISSSDLAVQNVSEFPSAYSLRNVGGAAVYNQEKGLTEFSGGVSYVTDVKLQNPWGTCWAFSLIAAAETSILSELGISADESDLDLSEHHLSWFAKTHLSEDSEEKYVYKSAASQAGEGFWHVEDSSAKMAGGELSYGSTTYSAGIGPVLESESSSLLYMGNSGEVMVLKPNGIKLYFESAEAAKEAGEIPFCYSDKDDWSLDESLRFLQSYELEESYILPDSNIYDENNDWTGYNGGIANGENEGVNAIKEQLLNGRGVSIVYCADTYRPDVNLGYYKDASRYTNINNWAHYTWDGTDSPNHAVTIIGYDDYYSAANFTITNPTVVDEYDHSVYRLLTTELENNENGDPFYVFEGEQIVINKDSSIIADTGKTDENQYPIYALTGEILENDENGNPLIPGTNEILINRDTLCDPLKEEGTYTPEGDGAWIVKNSWGSSENDFPNYRNYGNGGYFYISYYDKSLGESEAYNFNTELQTETNGYIAAYDYMMTLAADLFLFNQKASMINVFDTDQEEDAVKSILLDALSCNTYCPKTDVEYEIYVLNEDYENPFDGDCVASGSTSYEYGGYHRLELDAPLYIPAGRSYSVVITQSLMYNGKTVYPVAFCGAVNENYAQYAGLSRYRQGIINFGESFLTILDSEKEAVWLYDASAFVNSQLYTDLAYGGDGQRRSWVDYDNFNIKAYGNTSASELTLTADCNSFEEGKGKSIHYTIGTGLDGFVSSNIDRNKGLYVDGKKVDSKYITMRKGSTGFTLSVRYLNSLAAGEHRVRVYLKDSDTLAGLPEYIETTFTVTPRAEYTITIDGGSAAVNRTTVSKARENTRITISANDPGKGRAFDRWQVVSGRIKLENSKNQVTTFVMPSENVSIKAVYKNVNSGKNNGETGRKSSSKGVMGFIKSIFSILFM